MCIYVRPSRVPIFVKVKYRELRKVGEEGVRVDLDRLEEVTDEYKVSPEVLKGLISRVAPEEFLDALRSGEER